MIQFDNTSLLKKKKHLLINFYLKSIIFGIFNWYNQFYFSDMLKYIFVLFNFVAVDQLRMLLVKTS